MLQAFIYMRTLQVDETSSQMTVTVSEQIDGLAQDYSNPNVLAMEILQSCTKPSKWCGLFHMHLFKYT